MRTTTWEAQTLQRIFGPKRHGEIRRIASDMWWWGLYHPGVVGLRAWGEGAKTRRQAIVQATRAAAKLGWISYGPGLSR
jgi:hypothetical protein